MTPPDETPMPQTSSPASSMTRLAILMALARTCWPPFFASVGILS